MSKGIARYTSRLFSNTTRNHQQTGSRQDYKAKLWNTPAGGRAVAVAGEEVRVAAECPYADQVRKVVGEHGVAFQSLVVAALQTLQRVLFCEKQAAEAAISLAQGEKLRSMIESSETTAEAVAEALDTQGTHMIHLAAVEGGDEDSGGSWWFALTEAIQAIEDGTKRILSLASGQPKGSPGRRLSAVVVRLLRKQHQELLAEADAWIT